MLVPINAVTWTLGAIALYAFGLKSYRAYRATKNPLAMIYCWVGATFGTALFFFGVPALATQNLHVLRYTYFFADFFIQLTMQVSVWLLWFIGLRNLLPLWPLLGLTMTFSSVLLVLQAMTSHVSLDHAPLLVVYADKPPVLILKSIIYVCIALPIGYFFLRQVPRQTTASAKAKSLMTGLTFVIICLAATSNNIFDKGSDTPTSAVIVAVFFLLFLLVQLPSYRRSDH